MMFSHLAYSVNYLACVLITQTNQVWKYSFISFPKYAPLSAPYTLKQRGRGGGIFEYLIHLEPPGSLQYAISTVMTTIERMQLR